MGFARYRELLERDFTHFLLINFLTLLGILPFVLGTIYALLSSSLLVLLPASLLGGAIAGPFLGGLLDMMFRSMRDNHAHYIKSYLHALKQNASSTIPAGAITFFFIDIYAFLIMIWWTVGFPGALSLLLTALGALVLCMLLTIIWCQIVLFEQSLRQRLLNSLLFVIKYFWRLIGVAMLQIFYLACSLLFLPYTLLLLPVLGLWFIAFLTVFLLYNSIDEAFSLEEKIAATFPEQVPYYETDAEWIRRKRN